MNDAHSKFTGSIPEIYDTHLGPLLFDVCARDIAARVKDRIPATGTLLEVAAGTGIVTEQLRAALPEGIAIRATDLNGAMLDIARARRGTLANVTWEVADAMALPADDQSCDAVVCQFGIMFFPDKAQGLAEFKRVLKPGGLLAFNVWDSQENNPSVKLAHETISRFFDHDPPQFLKTPFGMSDIEPVRSLLNDAGFENIEVEVVSKTVEGLDPASIAKGFVEGNPGLQEIRERANADEHTVSRAVTEALDNSFGPAPLQIPIQEIVYTANKPG